MRDCVTVSGVGGRRARAAAPRAGRRAGRCAHPRRCHAKPKKLWYHSKVHMQSAGRAVRKGKAVLVRYSVRLNAQW